MNRRYTAIVVALFAIAALEFGLLGAAAAGITGGGSEELPPVAQRLGVPATDTPVATATVLSEFHIPQVDLTGASLLANPLTVRCDGSEDSIITVRVLQPNGDPPPDGTPVYPSTYNGNASPYIAYTHDGYATFSVRFYDDIFPSGPNFIIRSGLLEAGIRIRCNPDSDISACVSFSPPVCATPTPAPDCFGSPPQVSPPCPPTPNPCNPSPNSGPLSPPCATPEPCGISPPSVSPPCEPTPTPYPCNPSPAEPQSPPCNGATPFEVAVDCDVDQPGVQSYCVIPPNQNYDAAIVLINNSGSDVALEAFNFNLFNENTTALNPLPSTDLPPRVNGNPDLNEADISTGGWVCDPVNPDLVEGGPDSDSVLACFDQLFGSTPQIPNGSTVTLGTVHYAAGYGSTNLQVHFVALYDNSINELGSCVPALAVEMSCTGAFVETAPTPPTPGPSPTPVSSSLAFAIDCDPAATGIQDECTVDAVPGPLDVDVYVTNTGFVPLKIAAFDVSVLNPDTSRLVPNPGAPSGRDANPDFTAEPEPSLWQCLPVIADTGWDGDGVTSQSYIGCIFGGDPLTIEAQQSTPLFTIHYTKPEYVQNGSGQLTIYEGVAYDQAVEALGACTTPPGGPLAPCLGATIHFAAPTVTTTPSPTSTSTAVSTFTPTSTATRGQRSTPVLPVPTRRPAQPCADINSDGKVSIRDIQLIARAVRHANSSPQFDINLDGRVSESDIVRGITQFRRRC